MAFAPPATVEGAPRQPIPYGLFTTFALTESGERWENGVEWEYDCGRPQVAVSDDCDVAVVPKALTAKPGVADADRLDVYYRYRCAPTGYTTDQQQDKATSQLLAREQGAVERALWSGEANPSFATATLNDMQADYDIAATPPISSWDAAVVLGAVKRQIIRDYGSLGVIHVGPIGASILERYHLIAPKGDRMYTIDGWPVAVGDYPEAPIDPENPFPVGADQVVIVATPAMFGYRSEVFTHDPSLDQSVNEMHTIAERSYLIGWDPCVDPVYGLIGVPAEVNPGTVGGCGLRVSEPADNQVMDNPVFAVSGTGATPGAEVALWISDHLIGATTSTTADAEGNWTFDGDQPAKPGTHDWWVTSEGCRSNTVTLTVPPPAPEPTPAGTLMITQPVAGPFPPGEDLAPQAAISPNPHAEVEVTFYASWLGQAAGSATTDGTGYASMGTFPAPMEPGEYSMWATAPGYADSEASPFQVSQDAVVPRASTKASTSKTAAKKTTTRKKKSS